METKENFKKISEDFLIKNASNYDFNRKGTVKKCLKEILEKNKLIYDIVYYRILKDEILPQLGLRDRLKREETKISNNNEEIKKEKEPIKVEHICLGNDIDESIFTPIRSGKLIDKFFSDHTEEGGLVNGIYICIGDPGVGKTTLLADLCLSIEKNNKDVSGLFINSEMSRVDFGYEALKTPILKELKMVFLADYDKEDDYRNPLDVLEAFINSNKYNIVVLDSIKDTQDRILSWHIQNGLKVSSNYIEKQIINLMLKANQELGITFLLIQQINKGGDFVGSKGLEHNTTGLMEMRHSKDGRRYIKFKKNRRCGGLVNVPLFYSKDKITGEILFDEKDFIARIESKAFSEDNISKLEELANEFDSSFNETGGVSVDLNELGRLVLRKNIENTEVLETSI